MTIQELIAKAIDKSKQLLSLSIKSNWDKFSELEMERQALINAINLENTVLLESDYTCLQAQMNELIELNNKLEDVCMQQRSIIAKELNHHKKRSNAVQAYSQ